MAETAIALTGCTPRVELDPREKEDIVVYGDIYTAEIDSSKAIGEDGYYKMAEAMVIKDGIFVYVGDKSGANEYISGNCRIIDHRGRGTIIPGITDGHAHYMLKFINEEMKENTLQFTDEQKYEDVINQVRKFVEDARQSGRHLDYVYGEGYSCAKLKDTKTGKDLRHRKDLDAITTEIPIYLTGFDHHSTLVNTRAMINAGIVDEDGNEIRKHIAGGFMYRDEEKKLSGVFAERAISLLQGPGLNNKMHPSPEQITDGIDAMQKYLHSVGITNIIEGWTNNYGVDDESLFQELAEWDECGLLNLNVSLTYEIEPWYNENKPFVYVDRAAGILEKYRKYRHLHPDYIKLFMDGCVEMGTGFMIGSYLGGEKDTIFSGHGTALWSREAMDSLVYAANKKGLSVHTHAMGDGAVRRCVESYSAVGDDRLRNSICHLRNVAPGDYEAIKAHNIAVSSNMNWHCFTELEAGYFENILPEEYAYKAYPMKSFFENGILVSQCTDTPADNGINYPFYCMQVALTGAYEPSSYIWDKDEIINRYQFLQAMTYNGAWELHLEKERGSIRKDKYADFVILDSDILTCDVQKLVNVKVLKTFFEGQEVYSR